MNSNDVAKLLIDTGCLNLSVKKPFTYASGLQGPIYCDNRLLLSHVENRQIIFDAFCEKIQDEHIPYDSVAGLATGGIPYGMIIADKLSKPFIYVRSKPKEHGKQSQVEGHYEEGDRIILIEDLVNQAKSLGEAVDGVKKAKLNPVATFCLVDYQMNNAMSKVRDWGMPFFSLTNFKSIVEVALELGSITQSESDALWDWQGDPASWKA
jgi:orotate phosphoribosyltransferase